MWQFSFNFSRLRQGETIEEFVLVDEDGKDLKDSRAVAHRASGTIRDIRASGTSNRADPAVEQRARAYRKVEKSSLSPGIVADEDQHGDEVAVQKRGEEYMSLNEARGWTIQMVGCAWTLQRSRQALFRRKSALTALSAMRWLLLYQMKGATWTQSRSLLQAQLHVEYRQEASTAGEVKGAHLTASWPPRAQPSTRTSTAAEPKISGGEEEISGRRLRRAGRSLA